ncbi:MAG: DUF1631 family protein [Burkholderiales bacterium]|nr:DUF1631 family protein [Burkholderiales bacterium]
MDAAASHRIPPLLEAAAQRIKRSARAALERTVESLGLTALAAVEHGARDRMLAAQYELNRKASFFALAFDEELIDRLRRESLPRGVRQGPTTWDRLSLVGDDEIERGVSAERFGMELAHACEWELRELQAYMAGLLGDPGTANPLRPEVLGFALVKGAEAATDRPEIRAVFLAEIGRALVAEMRTSYQAIVADLHKAGIQPAGMSVRTAADTAATRSPGTSVSARFGDAGGAADSTLHAAPSTLGGGGAGSAHGGGHAGAPPTRSAAASTRAGGRASTHAGSFAPAGTLGEVDPRMTTVIRRLAHASAETTASGAGDWDTGASAPMPPNLIRAHRDQLRQAAGGTLDHMVIDVVGSLFDQILSDPKVAPQMARQIARLQLPVLRAALGDASFFSSRRHPVRRFVNRIASLAAAYDDFGSTDARRFLTRVKALVQDIVEGDFDRMEVYERNLDELERFVAKAAREEMRAEDGAADDPVALVEQRETELRLTLRYAAQLQAELERLQGPDFVREFLIETWSQVLMRAARKHGAAAEAFATLRAAARDLFMSVQPKGTPEQRRDFLAMLPKLMRTLNEGMDLIAWPDSARKAFFGLLLPAHAQSLKGQGLSTLDHNMLARRVDTAFGAPLPKPEDLTAAGRELPVLDDAIADPRFSPEEAARIGLLDESRLDWSQPVQADTQDEPPLTAVDIDIGGLPAPEPPAPMQGRALAEQVQLGCAYRMLLDDGWHKVRLSHVSPGRSCFMFTLGRQQRRTVSLTRRMLLKLCETGRLRAVESAYLLERATARARRQLASLGAAVA